MTTQALVKKQFGLNLIDSSDDLTDREVIKQKFRQLLELAQSTKDNIQDLQQRSWWKRLVANNTKDIAVCLGSMLEMQGTVLLVTGACIETNKDNLNMLGIIRTEQTAFLESLETALTGQVKNADQLYAISLIVRQQKVALENQISFREVSKDLQKKFLSLSNSIKDEANRIGKIETSTKRIEQLATTMNQNSAKSAERITSMETDIYDTKRDLANAVNNLQNNNTYLQKLSVHLAQHMPIGPSPVMPRHLHPKSFYFALVGAALMSITMSVISILVILKYIGFGR